MVTKFSEVFPNDLHGMPPNRDIDFCIDLETFTRFIYIHPYSMDLTKLREIKAQKLHDKGFILPSAFLWGAPVFFC